ncbi:MAG: hypothetical protein NW703_03665 [Nitrospiraceae bacterium]
MSTQLLSDAVRAKFIAELAGRSAPWIFILVWLVSSGIVGNVFHDSAVLPYAACAALLVSLGAVSLGRTMAEQRLREQDDQMLQVLYDEHQRKRLVRRIVIGGVFALVVALIFIGWMVDRPNETDREDVESNAPTKSVDQASPSPAQREEARLRGLEAQRERLQSQIRIIQAEEAAFVERNRKAVVAVGVLDREIREYASSKGWMELAVLMVQAVEAKRYCESYPSVCAETRETLSAYGRRIEAVRRQMLPLTEEVGYQLAVANHCRIPLRVSVEWQGKAGRESISNVVAPSQKRMWNLRGERQRVFASEVLMYALGEGDEHGGPHVEFAGDQILRIGSERFSARKAALERDQDTSQYVLRLQCES